MNSETINALLFFTGIGLIMLGVFSDMTSNPEDKIKNEAIELGYAQHNPITGDFEWKKKEDK